MATNTATPQEKKLEQLKEEEGEEEDEEEEIEALSLCDLPVNLINDETQPKPEPDSQIIETREDFDFRLWGTPFSSESEMCAADEVFFQGQILPLRLSLKRCQSRSESLGHGSLREFRSNSSRSSSIRSQNSTSSSSSTSTTTPGISKPRPQNQNQNHFHAHPSPQPQLKVTIPRQTSFGNQGRKSSAWDFFRLGVVPAPEIALQDLKVRSTNGINKNHIARNNSSNNSSNNSNSAVKRSYSAKGNHVLKQFVGIGGGFWSGCKCSVETVQSNITMIKGSTKSANKTESVTHAMKEKAVERKKQKQRQKQGKRTMSRRRTLEWIKELSHDASYADDETLLSKS
ncbi:pinin-like [Vigna umbellata]|uniref:pinin-like n=1 Tax=Vigna umbellata TaxID=87088 RepID=UPI001F5F3627|nr:pinin-like [Vigna umbellata]